MRRAGSRLALFLPRSSSLTNRRLTPAARASSPWVNPWALRAWRIAAPNSAALDMEARLIIFLNGKISEPSQGHNANYPVRDMPMQYERLQHKFSRTGLEVLAQYWLPAHSFDVAAERDLQTRHVASST